MARCVPSRSASIPAQANHAHAVGIDVLVILIDVAALQADLRGSFRPQLAACSRRARAWAERPASSGRICKAMAVQLLHVVGNAPACPTRPDSRPDRGFAPAPGCRRHWPLAACCAPATLLAGHWPRPLGPPTDRSAAPILSRRNRPRLGCALPGCATLLSATSMIRLVRSDDDVDLRDVHFHVQHRAAALGLVRLDAFLGRIDPAGNSAKRVERLVDHRLKADAVAVDKRQLRRRQRAAS